VIFTPPDGFPPASAVAVIIQCTDTTEVVRIPPHHPRSMRDERVTFTTLGYGKNTWEVPNRGYVDGRTVPPAWASRRAARRPGPASCWWPITSPCSTATPPINTRCS
jgi:hypothetical protein